MRSFLCAKLSLAMFLDSICLQSTLSIPLSLSVSWLSIHSLALEENKSPDCPPGKGSEDTLSLLGWVRVQTSCTLPTHSVEWRRPFARHQERTPSSPCGSLWHCSVETLGSFQTLWEHRSGLLDWPLLTRVQTPLCEDSLSQACGCPEEASMATVWLVLTTVSISLEHVRHKHNPESLPGCHSSRLALTQSPFSLLSKPSYIYVR